MSAETELKADEASQTRPASASSRLESKRPASPQLVSDCSMFDHPDADYHACRDRCPP